MDSEFQDQYYDVVASKGPDDLKAFMEKHKLSVDTPVGNDGDRPPLHSASYSKNYPNIDYLLSIGAKIDAVDSSGRTALNYAAYAGKTEVVLYLLKKGANPALADNTGVLPIEFATMGCEDKALKALVELKQDFSKAKHVLGRPLLLAARNPDISVLKRVIEMKADDQIDAVFSGGFTPLMTALSNGYIAHANLLLDSGAKKVDAVNEDGYTALHFAARANDLDIVKRLIALGVDPSGHFANNPDRPAMPHHYSENAELKAYLGDLVEKKKKQK